MPDSSLADTGVKFVNLVGSIANIALRFERPAVEVATTLQPLLGNFIPGYDAAIGVLRIADPIIAKVAAAAPAVAAGIDAGRPVIDAIQATAPQILPHLKQIYALAFNADPSRAVGEISSAHVSDARASGLAVAVLFGPKGWSDEATQRWWQKAQGDH